MIWFNDAEKAKKNLQEKEELLKKIKDSHDPMHANVIKYAKDYESKAYKYQYLKAYEKPDQEYFGKAKVTQEAAVLSLKTMNTYLRNSNFPSISVQYAKAQSETKIAAYQLRRELKCQKKLEGLPEGLKDVWKEYYRGKVEKFEAKENEVCKTEVAALQVKFKDYIAEDKRTSPLLPAAAFTATAPSVPAPSTSAAQQDAKLTSNKPPKPT